jgi:hypothetical protein
MKNNEHILANQQEFQAALKHATDAFSKFDGVEGVGAGSKQTGGGFTETIAIVVYVREKKPEEAVPPAQRIPPTFEDYPTDVRVIRTARPQACVENGTTAPQIQGGIRIAPKANGGVHKGGTLGCIVKRRQDAGRENVFLLTNKHVLYAPWAGDNDPVFHPFPPLGSNFVSPGDSKTLGPVVPPSFIGDVNFTLPDPDHPGQTHQVPFFLDCAIARIDIDCKCCGSTCTQDKIETAAKIVDLGIGDNSITDVRDAFTDLSILNQRVFKVGMLTRKTAGFVRGVGASVDAPSDFNNPNSPKVSVHNLLEIQFDTGSPPTQKNCNGRAWFSEEGDSGSLIVDEQRRAIGLLTLGPLHNDPDGTPSNACHIVRVLDRLNICIESPGTSHGSSSATDGSGVTPAPATASAAGSDDQIGFARDTVEAPWPAPAPLTDDEQRRMRALLDALHTTRKGRELHELFGHLRREAGYLVRNHKLVKVAWHRYKGPAFMAHVINHLKGNSATVPREVGGVSAETFLTHMAEVLMAYGSNPMREAIEQHAEEARAMLASGEIQTAEDCIAWLQKREAAA